MQFMPYDTKVYFTAGKNATLLELQQYILSPSLQFFTNDMQNDTDLLIIEKCLV